jgi:serine protease inhibitor
MLSAREMFVQINRPFIFMIRDEQSGSILFLGRMMDPSEKS